MAVSHTTFSFATADNYQGDLVEGREWPDGLPFSPNEQNLWTALDVTEIDKGDPLVVNNPWYVFWENNYIDHLLLVEWSLRQLPGPEVTNLPPTVQQLPAFIPGGPSIPARMDAVEDGVGENRTEVNALVDAIFDLRDRVIAIGSSVQNVRGLWAAGSYVLGDSAYREVPPTPPAMTWDELIAMSQPRATQRQDLRPELFP